MVEIMTLATIGVTVVIAIIIVLMSLRTVRPDSRGLIERFGKYNRFADPGLQVIIPFVERLVVVDITEDMVNAQPQEVITKDSLNAVVDAQIYFKVKEGEDDVKRSQYAVNDYYVQIVSLARTTLRAIIGDLTLTDANSKRDTINITLANQLRKETGKWGIEVVRAELKEIKPPDDVQTVMNEVVIAEKRKTAALDFATAIETEADGKKRAAIKEAEGTKQKQILEATGEAAAIEVVAKAIAQKIQVENEAAKKYFTGQAVELKRLETARDALGTNSKFFFVEKGTNLVNLVGDTAGANVVPLGLGKRKQVVD